MRPIEFPEANAMFAEESEYLPLPAWTDESEVVHCWRGTWRDRLRFLFTGKMWVHVLTFGKPLQPSSLRTDRPFKEE